MQRKISFKQAAVCIIGFIITAGILLFGIKEDIVGLEAALFAGTGILLITSREPSWLIYLQIIYCSFNKLIISQFGAPDMINYATDILMIFSFFFAIKQLYERREKTYILIPMIIAAAFFLLGTVSAMLHQVPVLLTLWSYRNLLRFFLFFFSCVVLLNSKDAKNMLKIFTFMFWLNFIVVSVQFWIQDYKQDNLGGIFGTDMGCNGHLNTFLCIYLAYVCVQYMARRMSFVYFLIVSGASLYIAALSELKFLFIEYVFILFMSILISRFSFRVVLMVIGAGIGLFIGLQLFNTYFPGWEFTVEQIMDYAGTGGYSTETDLNRITALQTVSQYFLRGTQNLLFGMGLGSCETSSYFQSTFFLQYGERLHYNYLLHAFTLLETGWIGLILFLGFFVSVGTLAWKYSKAVPSDRKTLCLTAMIMAAVCLTQCFYNNALRVENSGYLAFFVLAIPFICRKEEGRETCWIRKKS